MGIYIKNMRVPRGCTTCLFCGSYFCGAMPDNFTGSPEFDMDNVRPDWCPIVEMGELHVLDMAIEALSAPQTDLISRQAAINFACRIVWQDGETWNEVQDRITDGIESLPSADIMPRCITLLDNSTIESLPSADRPKEMAELKKVKKGEWAETIAYTCPECGTELMKPDRPKGEWCRQSDDNMDYWECSECGIAVGIDDVRNFCPNCGTDMRGDVKREPELGNILWGNSRGAFSLPRGKWQDKFAELIEAVNPNDWYGYAKENSPFKTIRGGYENEVFVLNPYYWGDDESIEDEPNFIFKPSGYELQWYKYPLRDAYGNVDVTFNQFAEMVDICILSIREKEGK